MIDTGGGRGYGQAFQALGARTRDFLAFAFVRVAFLAFAGALATVSVSVTVAVAVAFAGVAVAFAGASVTIATAASGTVSGALTFFVLVAAARVKCWGGSTAVVLSAS